MTLPKGPDEMTQAEIHSAGATVRHHSPFAALPVPSTPPKGTPLPDWSIPLFRTGLFDPDETLMLVGERISLVDADLVLALLSVFDWRPRVVGAHLAAFRGFTSLEHDVGNLLLRSDVCYAGSAYALALAHFNTTRAIQFLTDYLDYYLTRKDLWFEQRDVLAAVTCLDQRNGTTIARNYEARWRDYARDKPHLQLSSGIDHVRRQLDALERLTSSAKSPRDAG
jgi:hypothetical protein